MSDESWDSAMRLAFGRATKDNSIHSAVQVNLREPAGVDGPIIKPQPEEQADRVGRYHVVGEIARGGVGTILQARDPDLGRDVAMKVLHAVHEDNPLLVARFVEEAQIGGQLQHPGIVPVYEVGEDQTRRPYFTMKLVRGRTLSALLRERKDVAEERHRYLRVFEQVCETMAYAHARGVVHRDLKPANIMVGAFGEVQILDWGFAKVLSQGGVADELAAREEAITTVRSGPDGSDSVAGSALGTPAYMSPEQALGNVEALDERTDVFCLGAVLCEILTGKPPYVGAEAREILRQAAAGELDDTRARLASSGADPDLIALAGDCLRPGKNDRPAHASEVAARMHNHLSIVSERARSAEVEAAEARARAAEERKARRLTLLLAAIVLVGAAIGGFAYWERGKDQRAAERRITADLAAAEARVEVGEWTPAIERLERAAALAEAAPASDETRQLVSARLAEVRDRAREERLLAVIESIRSQEDLTPADDDERYVAAFREFGIDVESMDAREIAERLLRHGREHGEKLARALDDWASRIPRGPRWRKLVAAAQEADSDVWRYRLRKAILDDDRALLVSLVDDVAQQERDPESILLLAQALGGKEARAALRHGYRHHPGDYWINFALAVNALRGGERGPRGPRRRPRIEIRPGDIALGERHSRIALSLRPDAPEARIVLAVFLMRRSELAGGAHEAVDEVRMLFVEARARAKNDLGRRAIDAALLDLDGRREEALAIARELRAHPDLSPHLRFLLMNVFRGPR